MAWQRLAAILLLITIYCERCSSCEVDDVAVYKITLRTLWSEETFPKDYPNLFRPKAQWSPVFGQTHNNSYALYHVGELAKPSVRNFAQFGKLDDLVKEGDEEPKVYDQFSAPLIPTGVGETENMFFVNGEHSLVSFISRIIPSPDWFIGVDSFELCVDSAWVDEVTLDLEPLDAGAASGLSFTAPRWETSPPEPVTRHKPRKPNHPAAGFYYPELRELPTIAKVDLKKIKEYSTKDLNEIFRKEILSKIGPKDRHKGLPNLELYPEEFYDRVFKHEITTKSHLDQLKDLEEEPVGTPKPNLPDNDVIVVTRAPTFTTTTTEGEFESELKNMDDVVLAVANGRRLGLGKHLPRHFRSRLHHAVNRIEPDDCLVSEWSEWSQCSVTCGFGDKFRYRHIVRERRGDGRECPKLVEREHCGNVNSCAHIDYFEW